MLNGISHTASRFFLPKSPQENTGVSGDTLFRLTVAYDGSGRRISKTRWVKAQGDAGWQRKHVTHYTGIGTEVRENFAGPAKETKVVVNMPVFFRVTLTRLKPRSYIEKDILRLSNGGAILPKQSFGASRQGLGRYGIEDADHVAENGSAQTFEWFLKNHLGSTMLVYGTGAGTPGGLKAAYDYRSFGEQITMTSPSTGKVTENFTGKERDDETQLNYFGARYLDPMLGMWISVDPMRQFASPYLYAGNGYNPVNIVDPDGNAAYINIKGNDVTATVYVTFKGDAASDKNIQRYKKEVTEQLNGQYGRYNLTVKIVDFNPEIHKDKKNNVINLTKSANYKDCDGWSASCVTENFDEAYVYWKGGLHTWAHEFAHLLGLDDKYNRVYMDYVNNGKPLKGYDNDNLMVKGLNLNESQIEEMWSQGLIYPANGYKYNEVTREE